MTSPSGVDVAGRQIGDRAGTNVDPSGFRLSVAEIQQAFRELRDSRDQAAAPFAMDPVRTSSAAVAPPRGGSTASGGARPDRAVSALNLGLHTSSATAKDTLHTPSENPCDEGGLRLHTAPEPPRSTEGGARLGRDWIAVVAAHSGAGASCVALAITDALSAAGRPARLIEAAQPLRSGLVAAAAAELGTDPTGAWRRGSRQLATLYRRAGDSAPPGWPEQGSGDTSTIVDLGLVPPTNLAQLCADGPSVVLVCRVTVPGVRLAEHQLAQLAQAAQLDRGTVVLAAVCSGRWPGQVLASLGPHVRALRESGQVVTVPQDRHLQVSGATNAPLPKSVAAAGRALLDLTDIARPGGVTTSAPGAPRRKGTTR